MADPTPTEKAQEALEANLDSTVQSQQVDNTLITFRQQSDMLRALAYLSDKNARNRATKPRPSKMVMRSLQNQGDPDDSDS